MTDPAPPKKPEFNLLKACFYLLAFVIIVEMLATITGGLLCWWTNINTVRQVGACNSVTEIIRQVWSEILTAVLALLAARPPVP